MLISQKRLSGAGINIQELMPEKFFEYEQKETKNKQKINNYQYYTHQKNVIFTFK